MSRVTITMGVSSREERKEYARIGFVGGCQTKVVGVVESISAPF